MMFLPLAVLFALSVGPEVRLSTPVTDAAPHGRYSSRVASNGDGFLVVWMEEAGDIRAARVDRDGALIDDRAIVLTLGSRISVSVASDGEDYVVAYSCATQDISVCISRVDAETGAAIQVGRIPNALEPVVASNGDGYLLVYRGTRPSSPDSVILDAVFLREDGTVAGSAFRVANAVAQPAVASNGEDYLVVYSTYSALRSILVGGDGTVGTPELLTRQTAPTGPAAYAWAAASDGDGFLVAWQHNDWATGSYATILRVQPVGANGIAGAMRQLPATTRPVAPQVTWMGERYLVSYMQNEPTESESELGAADVRAFTVTRSGDDPRPLVLAGAATPEYGGSAAFNGTSTLAVWSHMYRYRAIEVEGRLLRNGQFVAGSEPAVYSRAVTNQQSVAAARIGGRVVTAWSENRGPQQFQKVFVQRLGDDGRPLDGQGIPAADSSRDQIHPALGGSALVWLDTDVDLYANPEGKVYLRFFNAAGELDPPILLGSAMRDSRVSVAAAGSLHLVTWELDGNVVAMRVSPTSGPLDAEPFVVLDAPRRALNPTVASDGVDFFVAANVEEYPEACGICFTFFSLHATAVSRFGVVTKAPFEVAGGASTNPQLLWNGSEYALFWARSGEEASGAFAQAFDEDGDATGAARALPSDAMPLAATWLGDEYLVALDHPQFPPWLLLLRLDREFSVLGTLPVYSAYRPRNSQAALVATRDGSALLAYVTGTKEDRLSSRAVARRIGEEAFVPRRRAVR